MVSCFACTSWCHQSGVVLEAESVRLILRTHRGARLPSSHQHRHPSCEIEVNPEIAQPRSSGYPAEQLAQAVAVRNNVDVGPRERLCEISSANVVNRNEEREERGGGKTVAVLVDEHRRACFQLTVKLELEWRSDILPDSRAA